MEMNLSGLRKRIMIAAGATALLGAICIPAGAASAAPAVSPVSPTPSQVASQVASEQIVARFIAATPVPVLPTNASGNQYLQFSQNLAAYWKTVPWGSVYGQWGCAVSDVQVDFHATAGSWGAAGAEMSTSSTCSVASNENGLVGQVATRSTLLARQASSSNVSAVKPLVRGSGSCAWTGGADYLCVNSPSTGVITGSNDYEGNFGIVDTGHIRLGQVGLTGCSLGTFVGNSPTWSMSPGTYKTYSHSVGVSSTWSNRWYDPSYEGETCGAY
jgi:hypothetical protein